MHWFILLGIGLAAGLIIAFLIFWLLALSLKKARPVDFDKGASLMKLLRSDIFEHVEAMQNNPDRFAKTLNIKKRESMDMPDNLLCAEHNFAEIFEHDGVVHNLTVCLSEESAKLLAGRHVLEQAANHLGSDWFDVIIDGSFKSKREVYDVLDSAYDYVAAK